MRTFEIFEGDRPYKDHPRGNSRGFIQGEFIQLNQSDKHLKRDDMTLILRPLCNLIPFVADRLQIAQHGSRCLFVAMARHGTLLPFVGDMSDGSSCRERTSGIYSTGIAERRELGRIRDGGFQAAQ